MEQHCFHIVINIKTADGYEPIGKFFLGNSRRAVADLFNQLIGYADYDEKSMIHLDLMETINSLPINIQMISCSLEELSENCRLITREIFKNINLEEIR